MRTERLTILVTREEKKRLAGLARQRRISVGELVRSAVARAGEEPPQPTATQIASLEDAAAAALIALGKADAALSRAEVELARTKSYFRSQPGEIRESSNAPRYMLERALRAVRQR